jgi:tetratricopeptide (TPR) repeat protein
LEHHDTPIKAREAIVKALALDPSLGEAHETLAKIKFFFDWDWSGAEVEHKQAIALSPNYATAHRWYSFELTAMGRLEEAKREIKLARDLDPYDIGIADWQGQVFYHARRYDDALREYQRALEIHPSVGGFYWEIADVYEQKKMFDEAFVARQQALRLYKDKSVAALDEAYRHAGYTGYLLKQAEFARAQNPPYAAHIYALLNDESHAIAALEAGYNERSTGLLFIRTAPELDSIRTSSGFRDLVRRIGFPPSPSDKN